MVLAEAWLDEAEGSPDRERDLQRELADLTDERLEALAAVDAAEARPLPKDTRADDEAAQERVRRAQAAFDVVDARQRNHVEAEAMVAALAADLAAAVEAERRGGRRGGRRRGLDRRRHRSGRAARGGCDADRRGARDPASRWSEATERLHAVTELETGNAPRAGLERSATPRRR